MVIVKSSPEADSANFKPTLDDVAEMGKFNEELHKAGIVVAAEGLHPSSLGKRVRFDGKNRTVIDGPFAETKELIAGFWIWNVKSMDEAVEWLKKAPFPDVAHPGASEVEIRRIFEAEDFGDNLTPELRVQEERTRQQAAALAS
jgi:hypothetical protein